MYNMAYNEYVSATSRVQVNKENLEEYLFTIVNYQA
jgi:hypothetical protein